MKYLLLIAVVVLLTIVNTDCQDDSTPEPATWARTYPIRQPKTQKTRPPQSIIQRNTTTALVRVSDGVLIGVPVALFVVTLGFGFIALILVVLGYVGHRATRVQRMYP